MPNANEMMPNQGNFAAVRTLASLPINFEPLDGRLDLDRLFRLLFDSCS